MRRLSASLEVFGADEVTLVGLGAHRDAGRSGPACAAALSDNAFALQRHPDCKPSGCSTRARRLCTRGLWNCPPRQWADTRHGREYQVPPAPRSLARKDESIVVGDAVVVRALVIDRQRLAIRRDDPMHGANDLPSLRERKVPCPGIDRLWRHAVGVRVAGNRIALAVGLVA